MRIVRGLLPFVAFAAIGFAQEVTSVILGVVTDPVDAVVNRAAFALAPVGTFGNVGVGILRQPTWWNFDASLDKRIQVKERLVIRMRFQAFNIFNHTEFNTIGSTFQWNAAGVDLNTTTGQYTGTQPPRQMALSARVEF